jgi:hypothetical protein
VPHREKVFVGIYAVMQRKENEFSQIEIRPWHASLGEARMVAGAVIEKIS